MLNKRCILLIFMGFLLFIHFKGIGYSLTRKTLEKGQTAPIEIYRVNRRKKVRDQWFQTAEKFAKKTNLKQASEIFEFVRDHSVLNVPYLDGTLGIEMPRKKDNNWFRFLPIIEDEDKGTIFWKGYLSDLFQKGYGTYHPEHKIIILTDYNNLTDLSRALIFFLTGYHARNYQSNSIVNWEDPKNFNKNNVRAYEVLIDLLEKEGGKRYKKMLERAVANFHYPYKDVLIDKISIQELEEIFGQANSERERNFWFTNVGIDVGFRYLEKNFKGEELEKEKSKFMERIIPSQCGMLSINNITARRNSCSFFNLIYGRQNVVIDFFRSRSQIDLNKIRD